MLCLFWSNGQCIWRRTVVNIFIHIFVGVFGSDHYIISDFSQAIFLSKSLFQDLVSSKFSSMFRCGWSLCLETAKFPKFSLLQFNESLAVSPKNLHENFLLKIGILSVKAIKKQPLLKHMWPRPCPSQNSVIYFIYK